MNTQEALHTPDWYLDRYDALTARFADVLAGADLDAPVPACGDWSVAQLAGHLGWVHRWANLCATRAAAPDRDDVTAIEPFDPSRAAEWFREGAATLGATMRDLDPDGPTWHPFPVEQLGRVWPRRQAHEVAVHLWDLESAVGDAGSIEPELASDGIDEYVGLVVPRRIARDGIEVPASSFHIHCTDVDGEWLQWNDDGEYRWKRAHEKGDAALRGPAEVILLELWARDHGRSDALSPVGDESALTAWTTLAGM